MDGGDDDLYDDDDDDDDSDHDVVGDVICDSRDDGNAELVGDGNSGD